MSVKNEKNNKEEETWKLWDAIFISGLISFFRDSQEAQSDDKKFRIMLLQLLLGIVFTVILFAVGFWILN